MKKEKEKFACECLECGHKLQSEKHCKDIECPECGGKMRRAERPGPGRSTETENKRFAIDELKVEKADDGVVSITGYANTKNKADRYGDVPTVFPELRNFVYDLREFKKNPVLLADHDNSGASIVGSFNPKLGGYIKEDDKGLAFKAIFMNDPPSEKVRHIQAAYAQGHGRALSIGGKWSHEDKDNPEHLTHAEIFEISLVPVGADPNALTEKSLEETKAAQRNLEQEVKDLRESIKAGRVISKSNENKLVKAQEMIGEVLKSIAKVDNDDDDDDGKILLV